MEALCLVTGLTRRGWAWQLVDDTDGTTLLCGITRHDTREQAFWDGMESVGAYADQEEQ